MPEHQGPSPTGSSPRARQPCTCAHVAFRPAGRMRARPGPGMLTQPGGSHPFNADAVCVAAAALTAKSEKQGTHSSRAASSLGPISAVPPPPKGNLGGARVDEIGGSERWRRNWGPRRRARSSHPNWKEPVLLAGSAAGEQPQRAPQGKSPNPQGAGETWRWARRGAEGREAAWGPARARPARGPRREGAGAPEHARAPTGSAAERRGLVAPGVQSRAWVGETGVACQGPRRRERGRLRAGLRRRYLP